MTKYTKYERHFPTRPWTIHPVWRGIGCALMIIIPIISFILAHEIVNGTLQFFPIPQMLLGYIHFPDFVWNTPVLSSLLRPIATYPNPLAVLVIGFTLLVILSVLISLIYAIIYRFIGPPRYSPIDAPPPKKRGRISRNR